MVYSYKQGARVKVSAQVAGEMCEALANEPGGLTPKRLLDANRSENAPLHSEFEWDDSIAAEAYREDQARYIIRVLVKAPEVKEAEPVRAFVRVTEDRGDYTPIGIVVKNQSMMDVLLAEAMKEMQNFVKKYRTLEQLGAVIDSMDEVLRKEDGEKRRMSA